MVQEAIVVGGGHNGLICAAYLARAGLGTLLLEARASTGGAASTVDALDGARVNICNCDHMVFRSTPVAEELDLDRFGLRYLDLDPVQLNAQWEGGPAWAVFHDVERTLACLQRTYPEEVDGYRRYLAAARPIAELVLDLANSVPTPGTTIRRSVLDHRARGIATLLRWSRASVADVLGRFFRSDALKAPVITTGPAVWGLPPDAPGTGLGAIGYALKHVARPGRPVGGSGALPDAVRAAFEHHGGKVRTSARVAAIVCEGGRVRGVELDDGELLEASVVVVAADPREAFVRWLRDPPAAAAAMVERWRSAPQHEGYESKLDAVITGLPRYRAVDEDLFASLGVADTLVPTLILSPSLDRIREAHRRKEAGQVADRPMHFVQVPSVLDPSMRLAGGEHVFSLETLWTPYSLQGGWHGSPEPERWLRTFADWTEPGFLDGVQRWRAVTPQVYEEEFHMPKGYATSFAGGPLAALLGRPRELTRYRTPVEGLYVTGAASFPGAGVWGAPGRNAATAVLARR